MLRIIPFIVALLAALACIATPSPAASLSGPYRAATCYEDEACWTWSTMGNRMRGVTTAWGNVRIVGPCGYARIVRSTPRAYRYLVGPALKGDSTALRIARTKGCGHATKGGGR